jgi:hypothetical protein
MPKGIVSHVYLLLEGGHRVSLDKAEDGRAQAIIGNPSRPDILRFALEDGGELTVFTTRIVGVEVS